MKKNYIEFVYCGCGCQKTLPRNNKWGATNKLIKGHTFKGKKHWNWNGGIRIHDGYIQIYFPTHPFAEKKGYVPEHRLVMEKHLGRYLTKDEVVHHINKNKQDNRIENLQIVTRKEHVIIHTTKDMSNRFCLICGQKTWKNKKGWAFWSKHNDGFICHRSRCRKSVIEEVV